MQRRQLLQGLSALAGALALPASQAWAQPQAESWTLGFDTLEAERLPQTGRLALDVRGKLPASLQGHFYRNGPARFQRAGQRYQHWFDGDGMVHDYAFDGQGLTYQAAYVRTAKYVSEQAAGRFNRSVYGTVVPNGQPLRQADDINSANIGILHHGGELLALWEGGSAYRLDDQNLDTLGPKRWRDDLAGMPFSAHPKIDADGSLWNFGIDGARGLMVLYHISARGSVNKTDIVQVPNLPMVHDFAITERHLVFVLMPFRLNRDKLASGLSIAASHTWRPNEATRVLLVDKNDTSRQRMVEIPTGFGFHLGNAWEDRDGVVRLSYMRSNDDTPFRRGFQVMSGHYEHARGASLCLATLDPATGRSTQTSMPEESEFPCIDARYTGRKYQQVVTVARTPTHQGLGYDRIQRRDLERGTVDAYDYGPDTLVEEHILVPDPHRTEEGSGWVIGTALNLKRRCTVVSVFEAMTLHQGPVAQAELPHAVPLGLHGSFHAAA